MVLRGMFLMNWSDFPVRKTLFCRAFVRNGFAVFETTSKYLPGIAAANCLAWSLLTKQVCRALQHVLLYGWLSSSLLKRKHAHTRRHDVQYKSFAKKTTYTLTSARTRSLH
jgi:hypothetical protein